MSIQPEHLDGPEIGRPDPARRPVGLAQRLRRRRARRGLTGVRTTDGLRLHVEEDGDAASAVTLVFAHGFSARLGEFSDQRAGLRERCRMVLYDHRGHGRSGWGRARNATVDQLGLDLLAVLEAHAPTGPVVLLGHSMGGITVMSLARQRPELFGSRIVGVFLLATSSGDLASTGPLGLFVKLLARMRLLTLYLFLLRLGSPALERLRQRGTPAGRRLVERYLFGTADAAPVLVDEVQRMLEETPWTITTSFYTSLFALDEVASLQAMRGIPVTVLVGAEDRLTPPGHSHKIAGQLPNARLVVVPGAGHCVNITRPDLVNEEIAHLLDRVQGTSRQAAGS